MRTNSYYVLKRLAGREHRNSCAGLETVRLHDRYFAKNRNKQGQDWFYMNYRETCCHMIGFIDAIIWLSRNCIIDVSPKYLVHPHEFADDCEFNEYNQNLDEYTRRLLSSLISSCETGADIDYNDGD